MINRIILIGRIGKDPETFKEGKIAKIPLATNESKKNQSGEWEDETTWHTVISFGNQAERMANYKKGNLIYVEGKMTYRKYEDKEGVKRLAPEVMCNYARVLTKEEAKQTASTEKAPWESY